jgi:glutamate synthase (NADPH/NADH) small chain
MENNKKYPKSSILKPLRHFKYLFKKPVTHPMKTIFTKKNAEVISSDRIIRPKWANESTWLKELTYL